MEVTAVQTPQPKKKRRSLKLGGGLWPYAFLTPYIVCYAVFSLFPIIFSFYISLTSWEGIGDKVFVGFRNYASVLTTDPYFWKSILNTIILMAMSIPLSLILGLLIAVFLFNLVRGRNLLQTLNFLPYVTTPVAIGLIFGFLFDRTSGTINQILLTLGIIDEGIYWLGQPLTARFVVAFMIIWKNTGYYMMLYLSGLASVPAELYEAAKVDGAGPLRRIMAITLPTMMPVITFQLIMSLGQILNNDFEQILMYYNAAVYDVADIIDTWVYRVGLGKMQYSLGQAVTMMKAVIGMVLIIGSNYVSNKVAGRGMW